MLISRRSYAGTLESSDLLVEISPSETDELDIEVTSSVEKQFGVAIEKVVRETLSQMGVKSGFVSVNDKGALDCIIRARVQAAVIRASETQEIEWGGLS
ncbi:citrate lyase acyl carrier protein [Vibrio sp. SCSIO 43137]|uniref:citrate lyase acyl carrier protein n=1 Tax=Vibrio sp. SCSIO 43137 TaxID=3021011 RepID=UPI0023070C0E|nr:citrate lyase acyl carrier protein [Vibrio sp. SCSIO 43137]WCE32450.1 citrate lyase acyl carrier protein [Vibrio sp. SCSIO 43137]